MTPPGESRAGAVPAGANGWDLVRRTVRRSVRSNLNCTIGSLNPDGSVHLTPIGSLILTDRGRGFYFDIFNDQLSRNIAADARVAILAVDSSKPMWLFSLLGGGFVRPPGVRLTGEIGAARPSTPDEVRKFHRVVGPLLATRGGRLLWGRLPRVRDVRIDSVLPLRIGSMTGAHPRAQIDAATLHQPDYTDPRLDSDAGASPSGAG